MSGQRFTTTPAGRYVLLVDGETGAQWPYLNQAAADAAADAANADPTHLRDSGATAVPPDVG
ncbi:hypothetical protein OG579_17160 [Williamsia herbipolensis]|uniref:Uncharacterized protein n=1 Tax=Williamsia herbipolensis TaxID=1603258 RepID=A0AAU4K072_9NOCA|nr:hypothetical protein [Williamsia herbipolensis]